MIDLQATSGWNLPSWYVIQTHGLREFRVENNLQTWGVETVNPKIKELRLIPGSQRSTCVIKSLFPSYIFARFNAYLMLHKICFTRGVRKILSVNGYPIPVSEEVINLIKSRTEEDGFIEIGPKLTAGDKVVVVEGPLTDLEGIFEKDINDSDRVLILLTAVNYQSRLLIERAFIKKSAADLPPKQASGVAPLLHSGSF